MPIEFKTIDRHCRCGKQLVLRNTRDISRKWFCSRRCRQQGRWARGDLAYWAAASAKGQALTGDAKRPKHDKPCECCKQAYLPTSARQRWCRICCPDEAARSRMQRYGLSQPVFEAMLEQQKGLCAVCRAGTPQVVDHDHACCPGTETCGKCVRGLLCNRCNVLLGIIEDSPRLLTQALNYLQ